MQPASTRDEVGSSGVRGCDPAGAGATCLMSSRKAADARQGTSVGASHLPSFAAPQEVLLSSSSQGQLAAAEHTAPHNHLHAARTFLSSSACSALLSPSCALPPPAGGAAPTAAAWPTRAICAGRQHLVCKGVQARVLLLCCVHLDMHAACLSELVPASQPKGGAPLVCCDKQPPMDLRCVSTHGLRSSVCWAAALQPCRRAAALPAHGSVEWPVRCGLA